MGGGVEVEGWRWRGGVEGWGWCGGGGVEGSSGWRRSEAAVTRRRTPYATGDTGPYMVAKTI